MVEWAVKRSVVLLLSEGVGRAMCSTLVDGGGGKKAKCCEDRTKSERETMEDEEEKTKEAQQMASLEVEVKARRPSYSPCDGNRVSVVKLSALDVHGNSDVGQIAGRVKAVWEPSLILHRDLDGDVGEGGAVGCWTAASRSRRKKGTRSLRLVSIEDSAW
ncbi:hypothetical protein BKA70DRAFT_1219624 [Coprinopsis sp. MPI-PUGE-AT-0042]|nr:hypothetical protein BKA70DRAFT_1219624 [Coprinopsis sp. MPI-PUGE-AT-0042]